MKLKKIITMSLAAMMAVSAMSVSAFAADRQITITNGLGEKEIITVTDSAEEMPAPTDISKEEIMQIIETKKTHTLARTTTLYEDSPCFIPYNVDGNQGSVICYFTPGTGEKNVSLHVTATGCSGKFNAQLYRYNGPNKAATMINKYDNRNFGGGLSQSGLSPNQEYFFMISSNDVPKEGADGTFTLVTY